MKDALVGINLPDVHADPDAVRKSLSALQEDGFDCVEISLDDFPLIINGEIRHEYVEFVKSLLSGFRFKYTAHIGRGLDLRDRGGFDLHEKVLRSSMEVSRLLGAELLVLHYESQSKDILVEERFLEAHVAAAEYAADLGLTLGLENIEVERVDPVVELVGRVNRSNFLLAFDTGHAFLAARYFHFDFLDSLRRALPHVGHVHLSDNVGTFEQLRLTNRHYYDGLPDGYRVTFGRGDIHIPPFWGTIPYAEVFRILKGYDGIYLCEYKSEKFLPFNKSIQEKVRSAVLSGRHPG